MILDNDVYCFFSFIISYQWPFSPTLILFLPTQPLCLCFHPLRCYINTCLISILCLALVFMISCRLRCLPFRVSFVVLLCHMPLTLKSLNWEKIEHCYRKINLLASNHPDLHMQVCIRSTDCISVWEYVKFLTTLVNSGSMDLGFPLNWATAVFTYISTQ